MDLTINRNENEDENENVNHTPKTHLVDSRRCPPSPCRPYWRTTSPPSFNGLNAGNQNNSKKKKKKKCNNSNN
jgi:hypothetical protein